MMGDMRSEYKLSPSVNYWRDVFVLEGLANAFMTANPKQP